jgi:histidine triad (HIT) family protein
MSNCIFCKIAKKEIPTSVEYEDEAIIAFNDKNPEAPVHMLIMPKEHIGRISDIGVKTSNLLREMALVAKEIARKKRLLDSGYRLVINCGKDGGQLIEHLHMHLLGGRQMGWPPG